ncbi:MAG: crossover junction endodeoxyribonuclease RuvC [Patescibacteria group bacterium]
MSILMSLGKKKIVLGIDPGLADTGYGVISCQSGRLEMIAYGSIQTKKGLELSDRLVTLEKELYRIIKRYQPDEAGVEQLFFCNNVKTALMVGQARGVVLLTLMKNQLPLCEFTPLQVKQAVTGYGQADKRQVQQMVKTILGLKDIPRPDDAADALAIAICASQWKKY